MHISILILLTEYNEREKVSNTLQNKGFAINRDFRVFGTEAELVGSGTLANEAQLLVTGAIDGSERETVRFVQMLKEHYPRLQAASFSSLDLSGEPFDTQIVKGRGEDLCQDLMAVMQGYLETRDVNAII